MARGLAGGFQSMVGLQEGASGGLAAFGPGAGDGHGENDISLSISIPEEDHHAGDHHVDHLAHHSFIVVASTTAGVTSVGSVDVPFALDATTAFLLRAAQLLL